jgi:hypothetical protein
MTTNQSCNRSKIFKLIRSGRSNFLDRSGPAGDRPVQKTFQTGKNRQKTGRFQTCFQTGENRLACHIIFSRLQEVTSKANEFPFLFLFLEIFQRKYHIIVVYVFKISQS